MKAFLLANEIKCLISFEFSMVFFKYRNTRTMVSGKPVGDGKCRETFRNATEL